MTAEELRSLHAEYRTAVEAARKPESEEAAAKAAADMIDLRHKLDAALIEDREDRENDAILAAVEARSAAAKLQALTAEPKREQRLTEMDGFKEFVTGKRTSFAIEGGKNGGLVPELRSTTDMTTADTTAYGSRLIPQTWQNTVRMFEIATSGVLQAGPTILTTASGEQMNYPTLTTDMVATAGAEGTAATNSVYPVFGTVPLNSYRIEGFVAISDEMLRDSGPDLESVLGQLAGRALGAKKAAYLGDIDIGTGSSLPAAITVGVTSAATCASTTAVTFDELKTLFYSVLPAYRMRGAWIANSAVTLSTALAKDGLGQYLWQPSTQAAEPDRFLGKPWYEDAYFDASAAGNIPVVFGDVAAAYVVRNIGGIEVSFSRDFAFSSFEVTMRFAEWFDAATVDAIAVKGLTLNT